MEISFIPVSSKPERTVLKRRKYDRDKIREDYLSGLSMPNLSKKYGISLSSCFKILKKAGINRSFSESMLLKNSGQTTTNKLVRVGKTKTRLISLPAAIIQKLGFDTEKELRGEWIIVEGYLCLKIAES